MNRKYTDDQRRELVDLVASKKATIREAATRIGVSYSTATRWVYGTRVRALVQTKPKFAQLVRTSAAEAVIHIRVGHAEIAVRRGVDVELLQTVVQALTGAVS
jgi:transposase-like protein